MKQTYVFPIVSGGRRCRLFLEGPATDKAGPSLIKVQQAIEDMDVARVPFTAIRQQAIELLRAEGFARIAH